MTIILSRCDFIEADPDFEFGPLDDPDQNCPFDQILYKLGVPIEERVYTNQIELEVDTFNYE